MTTPPGNTPPSGGSGGPHGAGQGQRQQPPPLTEDMLTQKKGRGGKGGRSRKSSSRKPEQPAPPNPWLAAGSSRAVGGAHAPSQGAAPSPGVPGQGQEAVKGKKGRKAAKASAARRQESGKEQQGNGWFRNPFAKPSAPSPTGRGNASTAQMWAGPRRGILLRRMLALLGVLLLLYVSVTLKGKADRSDVEGLVRKNVKSSMVSFPKGDAVMWAAPLVKAFATYDPSNVEKRAQALKPYALNGIDEQMGWNGQGKQTVIDLVMSDDVQVTDADHAVVRATVQVQDGSWRCVSVPVFTTKRGGVTAFGLTAAPVYTSCAGLTSPPASDDQSLSNDASLANMFKSDLLPGFMAAWVQSDTDNLRRYMLPGAKSFGLGGAYSGKGGGNRPEIGDVSVPKAEDGQDTSRRIVTFTATMTGSDGKAEQESTYQVPVRKQNGQWYFASDPVPAVRSHQVGGNQVPDAQPSQGTGDMYSKPPKPKS